MFGGVHNEDYALMAAIVLLCFNLPDAAYIRYLVLTESSEAGDTAHISSLCICVLVYTATFLGTAEA